MKHNSMGESIREFNTLPEEERLNRSRWTPSDLMVIFERMYTPSIPMRFIYKGEEITIDGIDLIRVEDISMGGGGKGIEKEVVVRMM